MVIGSNLWDQLRVAGWREAASPGCYNTVSEHTHTEDSSFHVNV